jgi:hypothetical protein
VRLLDFFHFQTTDRDASKVLVLMLPPKRCSEPKSASPSASQPLRQRLSVLSLRCSLTRAPWSSHKLVLYNILNYIILRPSLLAGLLSVDTTGAKIYRPLPSCFPHSSQQQRIQRPMSHSESQVGYSEYPMFDEKILRNALTQL